MKFIDLFCGGGGASYGYQQAGFHPVIAIDNAWHCIQTYRNNFGDIAKLLDISKLRSEKILSNLSNKPTLVTASPPCEPFTSANVSRIKNPFDRLFTNDTGRLMLHAIRLIADLEPKFFVIENVRGILDGDGKQLLTEEFNRVGLNNPIFNYIEAVDFGVPSQRTRIYITNFPIKNPRLKHKTVMDVIGNLPDPNYPHKYEYHSPTFISSSTHKKKMLTLPEGEGLVYFRGSKSDYKNFIRLFPNRSAPVVMGKSRFIHPLDDRVLTPFENGRLMTFPDTFKYHGTKEQIYDIIGEAIPPKITYEIGKQILTLL